MTHCLIRHLTITGRLDLLTENIISNRMNINEVLGIAIHILDKGSYDYFYHKVYYLLDSKD